jgi:DnaJ-class molecular chaperone
LPTVKEYYTTLGLDENASVEDLKKAYKKKALETHPDQGGNQEEFLKVQEAWEVLSGKRPASREHQNPHPNGNYNWGFPDIDFSSFGFNPFQGSPRQEQQRPPTSDNGVRVTLQSNIEEVKQGKVYRVKYTKSVDCVDCQGKGAEKAERCEPCKGIGMIQHMNQHAAGFYFVQNISCDKCGGLGKIFTNPCKVCVTKGYTTKEEKLAFKFEVIEEK